MSTSLTCVLELSIVIPRPETGELWRRWTLANFISRIRCHGIAVSLQTETEIWKSDKKNMLSFPLPLAFCQPFSAIEFSTCAKSFANANSYSLPGGGGRSFCYSWMAVWVRRRTTWWRRTKVADWREIVLHAQCKLSRPASKGSLLARGHEAAAVHLFAFMLNK